MLSSQERAWLLRVAILATTGVCTLAQESPLRLSGDLALSRLVDLCAERLGTAIEYQPKVLTESVTLRGDVDDQQLWALTNRLLAARGFTTIRVGDSPALSVVRLLDAMGTARIERSLDAIDSAPAGYVRVLAPIANRDVASVLEAIRPLLSRPGGETAAVGRERTILVSDLRPRVVEILAFVAALDAAPPEVSATRIELGHLDGQPMATLAMQVALKREVASGVKTPGEVVASGDARARRRIRQKYEQRLDDAPTSPYNTLSCSLQRPTSPPPPSTPGSWPRSTSPRPSRF
ncbi:MAG: hypothetical protein H6811_11360 [Phycisphaeraceae bacterium]|nr:hypothetical protein [Phycisphaeraceae bacterium]